ALIGVLEEAVPQSSHAETVARLRCFRGIDTLTAAGLCAEVGDFARFPKPALLSGFLGVVPSEYTSDEKRTQGHITKAGPTNARRHFSTSLVVALEGWSQNPAWKRERGGFIRDVDGDLRAEHVLRAGVPRGLLGRPPRGACA